MIQSDRIESNRKKCFCGLRERIRSKRRSVPCMCEAESDSETTVKDERREAVQLLTLDSRLFTAPTVPTPTANTTEKRKQERTDETECTWLIERTERQCICMRVLVCTRMRVSLRVLYDEICMWHFKMWGGRTSSVPKITMRNWNNADTHPWPTLHIAIHAK